MDSDQEQADAQQESPPDPPVQERPTDTAPQDTDATVRVRFTVPASAPHPIMAGGRSWDDNTELDIPAADAAALLKQPGFSEVTPTP